MAPVVESVLLNTPLRDRLFATQRKQNTPHALLLVGGDRKEKLAVALGFAQNLLCEIPTSEKLACGECASCKRVAAQRSESVLHLHAEKKLIRIEQARSILDFLSMRALGAGRVIIIHDAPLLNPAAANTLLKVLEEPPPNTYFFLFVDSEKQVLPTIRSRCQLLHLKSQDAFDRAKELLQEPEEQALLQSAVFILKTWIADPQGYLLASVREKLKDREFVSQLSQYLSALLRDAVIFQIQAEAPLLYPQQKALYRELSVFPMQKLAETQALAQGIERHLRENKDLSLVFEEFWIRSQKL